MAETYRIAQFGVLNTASVFPVVEAVKKISSSFFASDGDLAEMAYEFVCYIPDYDTCKMMVRRQIS